MDTIHIHVLTSDPGMNTLASEVKEGVDAVLPAAAKAIDARNVDIVVGANPAFTIPETGVGGSTQSSHIVFAWIDPEHENIKQNLKKEIGRTVTHELHHAMRNRSHPWPGTLLEDIVGEGLADHFDLEINGGEPLPWATALSEKELTELYKRAEPLFHVQGDGYPNWLFGSPEENIPRWTGYALGFKIVGDYLEKTGKRASELVEEPARVFVE